MLNNKQYIHVRYGWLHSSACMTSNSNTRYTNKHWWLWLHTPVINWKNSDNFLCKLPNSVLLCIKIHALLLNYQLNCKLSYNETEIVSMLSSITHQFVIRDRHIMMYCIEILTENVYTMYISILSANQYFRVIHEHRVYMMALWACVESVTSHHVLSIHLCKSTNERACTLAAAAFPPSFCPQYSESQRKHAV